MINIVYADGKSEFKFLKDFSLRSEQVSLQVEAAVAEIINNVKNNKDEAVRQYTLQFDKVNVEKISYSRKELDSFVSLCDPEVIKALKEAAKNIEAFHNRMKQQSWLQTDDMGCILGQRVRGLNRVGIYVPGGTAAYPSSVLMNAIPARIAEVNEIIMVTPPDSNGLANPVIMAAAAIAGVDRVLLCGGAQSIAALAYGTETFPKVDKIVGPGNIYVATAKRKLYGVVDIDMIAGPSEILIMADRQANPKYIAADMISQAEHDVMASSILLTDSQDIAKKVLLELDRQVESLPRREIVLKSLSQYGAIIISENTDKMIELANLIAPEHLEVLMENPMEYLGRLDNVGSVFLGEYAPESLGDYYAGPNHVLPTSGTARFFSPLSVDSFVKKSSFIYYTKQALKSAKPAVTAIAEAEGLKGHANSVKVRFED